MVIRISGDGILFLFSNMKIKLSALIIIIISVTACKSKTNGDEKIIAEKYLQKANLVSKIDTAIFNEVKEIYQKLTITYNHTCSCNPAADSSWPDYNKELIAIKSNHPVLESGTIAIHDKDNPHILAYTSTSEKEELLTILNMDEDNWAFVGSYDYAQMPLLLCNYDDGGLPVLKNSLMLRPFEARIYQVR